MSNPWNSNRRRSLALVLFFLLGAEADTARGEAGAPAIVVENIESGETVRHSLVLLRGRLPEGAERLEIANLDAPAYAEPIRCLLHEGKFRALVELAPGRNRLTLRAGDDTPSRAFELSFKPQENPHYVRLVWMTDSSGDTTFAAPNDETPQDYENRLRTAGLLMQAFTAERMHESGYGRRTFRLERDADARVVVRTLRGPLTMAEYHAISDQGRWYGGVHRWINQEHKDAYAKNCVVAAYTRKDPETGELRSHTALGGGNLGLFGGASVFSWPSSVAEAADVMLDDSRFDASRVHDDSVGRSTIWGLASTTIGATLHEMGHSFGLPHVEDPRGIMRRGFDQFNRFFTFYDPSSGRSRNRVYFEPDQEAYFAPISASYLRWSPWLQLDNTTLSEAKPVVRLDRQAGLVECSCPAGVTWVGFHAGDTINAFREFNAEAPPEQVTIRLAEIEAELRGRPITQIRALSAGGVEGSERL